MSDEKAKQQSTAAVVLLISVGLITIGIGCYSVPAALITLGGFGLVFAIGMIMRIEDGD